MIVIQKFANSPEPLMSMFLLLEFVGSVGMQEAPKSSQDAPEAPQDA